MEKQIGGCACGHVEFEITGNPLVRACCHCTICQKFNEAAYADILIFDRSSIDGPTYGAIDYKSYKAKSPILRGKCAKCGVPVLEKTISGPKMWIVPVSAYKSETELADPVAHIFYDTRVADVDDGFPKYESALKSNLVLGKHVVLAKIFKRKPKPHS